MKAFAALLILLVSSLPAAGMEVTIKKFSTTIFNCRSEFVGTTAHVDREFTGQVCVSLSGTPYAECAVIVVEYPSLRGQPQSFFDGQMLEAQDVKEVAQQLSTTSSNVTVLNTGVSNISGHPAQVSNVLYSVGTPSGVLLG